MLGLLGVFQSGTKKKMNYHGDFKFACLPGKKSKTKYANHQKTNKYSQAIAHFFPF